MGAPASAKNVKLGIDFEQSFGTVKASPTLRYLSFLKAPPSASQGLIMNKSIRADLNPLAPVYDKQDAGVQLTHYPTLETIPLFQKWLLGTLVETGTTPNYILTSKLGTTLPPSVVIEQELSIGGTARFLQMLGLTVESFDVEWDVSGFLQFTINAVGKSGEVETVTIDASPDDWTAGDPLNHLQISSLLLGGASTTVIKKGKISVKFNPYKDDYRAGQGAYRLSLVQDTVEISGTLDIVIDSTTILGDMSTGIAGSSLKLVWTQAANRYFSIELPKITVQKDMPKVGDSPILMIPGAQFVAYYDSTAASSIVMVTGTADVATKYA